MDSDIKKENEITERIVRDAKKLSSDIATLSRKAEKEEAPEARETRQSGGARKSRGSGA